MVIHYKCSSCGADMNFSAKEGNLHCSSCGNIEDIDKMIQEEQGTEGGSSNYSMDDEDKKLSDSSFEYDYSDSSFEDEEIQHNTFTDEGANHYQCNNCGAALITDSQTSATTCSFCGAGIVLGDRLSGDLAPSKVIPFSISQEDAQGAFRKWCKNGRLTPNGFMTEERVTGITGLYVPFWLFDINGKGDVSATCTKVRTYTRGEYIYTETKYYNVYRKVDLDYTKIPADASKKMDDALMDKLEPFPYANLKVFNMPYLSGFIAEKYDFDDATVLPRVKSRVKAYVDTYVSNTMSEYSTVRYNHKNINIRQKNAEYALLPVWMVSYDYQDKNYTFAMNGQTGKVVGQPPIAKSKVIRWFAMVSGISFIIIKILALITGGGLW